MLRSLALALAVSLLLAAVPAAVATPPKPAFVQIAEAAAQCRAKCERLRAGCSGSQCRAAYAACIASCR